MENLAHSPCDDFTAFAVAVAIAIAIAIAEK